MICVLFVCAGVTGFAQQEVAGGPKVLIDFQSLEGTDVDFSRYPGAMAEGIEELKVDMSIPNWAVKLAPSSASAENRILSFAKPVPSRQMQGDVMGIRVHFPTAPFNSWAQIMPPFEIPFYEQVISSSTRAFCEMWVPSSPYQCG